MNEAGNFWVLVYLVFIYALPLCFVLSDPGIGKGEKVIWSALILLFSWLACIVYFWIAPLWPNDVDRDDELERIEPRIGDH